MPITPLRTASSLFSPSTYGSTAYYLDYQNRRAAHLAALWQIVNWEVIEKRYGQEA